jgi:hypothetical protein
MYCVSLVDRTNVAAASVAGMIEDLRLISNRSIVTTTALLMTLPGHIPKLPLGINLIRFPGPLVDARGQT